MTTLIDRLGQALKDAGFNVSIWNSPPFGRRIYFHNIARHLKIYIQANEPEKEVTPGMALNEGCHLEVVDRYYSTPPGKLSPKQVKYALMLRLYARKITNFQPYESDLT